MTAQVKPSFVVVERRDGFWLWDETRGMNLSVRAKTERDAFTDALKYYQNRLQQVETAYKDLQTKVDSFVESVTPENDDDDD